MHQVGNWLRLKIHLLEIGPLAFATIHEQQFSLPHYCVNCDLPSVASAAQTKGLMVQKLPVKRLQQLLFSTCHFVELHCRAWGSPLATNHVFRLLEQHFKISPVFQYDEMAVHERLWMQVPDSYHDGIFEVVPRRDIRIPFSEIIMRDIDILVE